ncbi:WD40-repeat-containing domain protein [Zychaea mexicana]|uniref:WD40-repeat-containing domain protein n=1 Tax=Zychaea mexicana TaxID=64656 RepID=UPI0022FEDD67|nr:WD40-repeat-containing domain protein [Zychaea mexicana]KAI9491197.1 WD40-repeat-containing domain protein [Zychaea mexicana]
MTPVTTEVREHDPVSSDDDTGIYFEARKSAALPIPNSSPRSKQQQQHQQNAASSSSSSVERGILPASSSAASNSLANTSSTNNNSNNITRTSTNGVLSGSITPSTSTPFIQQPQHEAPLTTLTIPEGSISTSIGASSSVGSLSSLFSRNSLRHHHHHLHHHPKKPKNSLIKTNSSFVVRMTVHEKLSNILATRTIDDTYLFFNVGMNFVWMDGSQKVKECLSKIIFSKAYPTCHDVNKATNGSDHMDVIIGFSTGDCMWYDPISSKYARLNKGGIVNTSVATCVKWVPGSEELFLISFSDGSVLLMDKERDDQAFTPASPSSWAEQQFQVTKPRKSAKYNPVSHWKVADKSITALEFSPEGSNVAVACADGTLRIIDYTNERLCDVYAGYFGKLHCVAWSPDGRYILTGGQDDLVTIWSLHEQKIVARCQGHKSWVTAVAFDPWKCDDKVYRFGSVGEDCRMILWDFSFSALHRPKHVYHAPKSPPILSSNHHTPVRRSKSRLSRFRRRTSRSANVFGDHDDEDDDSMYTHDQALHLRLATMHPILNKDQVPYLQPVMSQTVHADPCTYISFHKDCIVTADRRGKVRTWGRP